MRFRLSPAFLVLALLATASPTIAPSCAVAEERVAEDERLLDETDPAAFLPPRHRRWLEEVDLLISEAEREVFLALDADYQRDAFVDRFWEVRDPFRQTPRNEFEERWEEKVRAARVEFDDLTTERARMMLLFGAPSRRTPITCTALRETVDVWHYQEGSDLVGGYFTLIFLGFHRGSDDFRLWSPTEGLGPMISSVHASGGSSNAALGQALARQCPRGDDLLHSLALALDVSDLERRGRVIPEVNEEWVLSFRARSTEVPDDAPRMEGRLDLSFPGRHQSRTVVQGLLTLPASEVEKKTLGRHEGYHFVVDGEVLRRGELFEQFRYRFDVPAEMTAPAETAGEGEEVLPLVVQRYLRPGEYTLVLKVEDSTAGSFYRVERQVEVPRVEPRRRVKTVDADGRVRTLTREELATLETSPGGRDDAAEDLSHDLSEALSEANASISTGDHAVKLRPLPAVLQVGKLRVDASVRGEGIDKVTFFLDDRPVMSKRRPPWSVELDLGQEPRIHTLRVEAVDDAGTFLAADEVLVNAGPHRFAVRLIEPQRGKRYTKSVRVHAEVEVPEGERLERVEIFLEETQLATLYQPPFEQPVLLPPEIASGDRMAYVRAVAYLHDGATAEDVQFINAPDYVDDLQVNFVELFTSVLDRKGDFVEGLSKEDFEVFEDGEKQEIRRFETMRDLPIRAGLVLDTSLSMEPALPEVERAAYGFFETVLEPRDRACLITFAEEPRLAVRFTNDKGILAGGLSGLVADGETALYDSIVFALHYFSGLEGKRAIIVLTDGEDSMSRYGYQDAVGFARRTGASIYVIGLNLSPSDQDVRNQLHRLSGATGGEAFFIDSAHNLSRVYERIQEELRSQYLIAYQSTQSSSKREDDYREVEIRVSDDDLEAKSIPGYYP